MYIYLAEHVCIYLAVGLDIVVAVSVHFLLLLPHHLMIVAVELPIDGNKRSKLELTINKQLV